MISLLRVKCSVFVTRASAGTSWWGLLALRTVAWCPVTSLVPFVGVGWLVRKVVAYGTNCAGDCLMSAA